MQVVSAVDAIIEIFEDAQNAPKDLRDFRLSAARLARHFAAFQADYEAHGSTLLHIDDIEEIRETLVLCYQELQNQDDVRQGTVSRTLRTFWPKQSNRRLARYKHRIDEHYQQILLPTWVELAR